MVSSISVTTKSALVRAPKTMPSTVTSFCPKSGIMKLGPVGDSREHCTTIFIARVSETEVIVGSDSRVTRFKKKSQIVTEDQLHKYRIFGSVMITCSGSLSRFDKAMKFLTETLNSRTKARTKRYDVKNIINVLKDFFRRRREDDDDDEDDDEDDDDDDDDDDDVDDNPGGDPGVLEDTCTLHVIGWIKSEMRCGIFRVGDHYKDANEVKDKICGSGSGYFIAEHLFQSSNLDLNCENIVKILAMTSVYDTYTGGALRAFSLREGADVVVYKPVDLIHALLPSMDRNITHNVFIPSGLFIVIQFHDQTKLTRKNLIDMMTRVILTHDFSTSVNIVTNTSRSLLVYYLKIRCFDHRQLMLDHFGLLGKLKYPRFVTYVKGASRCNFLIGSAKKVFLENVGRARTLGELFRLKSLTIKRAIKKRNAARHARIQMAHPGAALQGCDIVGALKVTKDGVTVAKAIEFKDRVMNVGANLVKQVANATNDVARDGTTCATILTRAIYAEGCKSVAAGMNAMDLRCGINMAVDYVVTNLKSRARMISTSEEIAQVGTIFVNGDREIGELIAKAMERVGIDGVITIGDGNLLSNELEVLEGMKLDRGYISPQFITNQKNQKCELEDVLILIHEKKIESTVSLVKVLELAYNKQKPLLIVSEDLGSEVLGLILNKLRVGLKVCAIKAPGFGENKKAYLEDLAVLTGGEVITSELGINLEDVTVDTLGSCKKVTVSKDDTIILDGAGNKKSIEERCEQLRSGIELSTSDYDKEKLQERLAKLSGGVAVLKIGGASESEVGEKKDRVTDALNATKAAVEEGIVPGGGVALLYASKELDKLETANFDQKIGVQIIQNAVKVLYTIALNAGVEGAVVVGKLLEQDNPDLGYDASKGDYVDMVKAGIIDPLKVIKSALVDAASVSSLLTTTEAVIVTVIKDLKYSESHEWVKVEGTSATVGITDHAQDHLGDVVYVELPEEGIHVKQNESFGAVESVKAASIINSPISGKVVGVNTQLNESPGLVNGSPYEKGWIIKVEIEDASELNHLMDSDLYSKFCEEENANH